jgi:hypothetical protein
MKKGYRVKVLAVVCLVALTGIACGKENKTEVAAASATDAASGKPNFSEAYTQAREAYAHMFMTADGLAGAIAKQKKLGVVSNKAIDVRQTLDKLLGEHAILAAFTMQKGLDGAADFDASAAALDANSVALGKTIESVYGKPAGDAFLKQWRDHIRMFVDFTVGTATNDAAKRNAALKELAGYKESFAKFLTENTGLAKDAGLQASAVAGLLQSHVDQLVKALDTYKAKRFDLAYQQVRASYHHMYATGDGLAGAISKQKKLGNPSEGAANTRIAMDRLLGEHAILAVFTMQKGSASKPDFPAIGAALDKNSVELADVIGSVYGKPARDAFLKQWRDHIRMFVDFTVGTATDDDAKRQTALDELGNYKESFAKFLTENTGLAKDSGLEAGAVSGLLQSHVNQLTAALDSYLGK